MFQYKQKTVPLITLLLIILAVVQVASAAPTTVDGEFRSYNGTNNNLSRLDSGSTLTQLLRLAPSAYGDTEMTTPREQINEITT